MSSSLWPHELQRSRLPCLSPSPGACSNSCLLSWWCHPTILSSVPFPPAFNLSQHQGLFQWAARHIRWPKYWSFSFSISISPSNEYSWFISIRIDWFDLLAVQGTLKSLLQHHSSKTSALRCSAFFVLQLSHPSMTTGKNKALTMWTFVSKVMSLLCNRPSRFVVDFLPRNEIRSQKVELAKDHAFCLECPPTSCLFALKEASVHVVSWPMKRAMARNWGRLWSKVTEGLWPSVQWLLRN